MSGAFYLCCYYNLLKKDTFTVSLAQEVASRGITVNAVAPGILESAMTTQIFDKEKIKQLVPMKRTGKPEEVAALVGFLC